MGRRKNPNTFVEKKARGCRSLFRRTSNQLSKAESDSPRRSRCARSAMAAGFGVLFVSANMLGLICYATVLAAATWQICRESATAMKPGMGRAGRALRARRADSLANAERQLARSAVLRTAVGPSFGLSTVVRVLRATAAASGTACSTGQLLACVPRFGPKYCDRFRPSSAVLPIRHCAYSRLALGRGVSRCSSRCRAFICRFGRLLMRRA